MMKNNEEKDLGVMIQDSLSPGRHINGIFGPTCSLLTNMNVAFNYLDREIMKKIITSICPKLEYTAVVWTPHRKKRYTGTGKNTEDSNKDNTRIERHNP